MKRFGHAVLAALILAAPALAADAPSNAAARQDEIRNEISGGKLSDALAHADALCAGLAKAPAADQADALRLKAHVQRLLKDDAGAADSLSHARALLPEDSRTLSALADAQAALGKKEQALGTLDRLEKAVEKESEAAVAGARAQVLRQQAAVKGRFGDSKGARKALEKAAGLRPDSTDVLKDLTEAELADGRPAQALDAAKRWEKAAEGGPVERRADAVRAQARALRAEKDLQGARAALERVAALSPSDASSLGDLASLQADLGDTRAAVETLSRAEEGAASPEAKGAFARRLAQLHDAANEPLQARSAAERALSAAPGDLSLLFLVVRGSTSSSKQSLALVDANKPADAKQQPAWQAIRGLARFKAKDDAGAKKDFDAAVAADGKGVCFGAPFSKAPDAMAPAFYDACLTAFPQEAFLYADRGIVRFMTGQKDDAITDFRRAVELRPADTGTWLSLLSALASQGRIAEALAAADKALSSVKDRGSREYKQLAEQRDALRKASK